MGEVEIRRATPEDRGSVLSLLRIALGWTDDPRYDDLFRWKHDANPFGPSPAWIALDSEQVIGFRTFMRWEFERGGEVVHAVRAVDTATHPDHQGRGVFRRLTLHALDELRSEDVAFIFNTPNDQSRPGYLKMGWGDVGRLPVRIRPRNLATLSKIARARTPADLWPCELGDLPGVPAADVFGETNAVAELLDGVPTAKGLTTRRTPTYLAWRYGLASLGYRVLAVGSEPGDGLVVFRVRRRGRALEAAVLETLLPSPAPGYSSVIRRVVRESGADYAIGLGPVSSGLRLPLPRQGPVLVHRGMLESPGPPLRRWHLSLGDVELF